MLYRQLSFRVAATLILLAMLPSVSVRGAIVVTNNVNPLGLANALALGGGLTITTANLASVQQIVPFGLASTGVFQVTGPYPDTYGLRHGGVVLSTGAVTQLNTGPDTPELNVNYNTSTMAYDSILDPIATPFGWGGYAYHDVTKLDITFDMAPGKDRVYFDLIWGSDQPPPDPINWFHNDVFVALLNGTNVALANSNAMTVRNPDMKASATVMNPGTALSWLARPGPNGSSPILQISAAVTPGSKNNTLSFIIADLNDGYCDSAVFLSGLRGNPLVPEPSTLALTLLGGGAIGFALWRRARLGGRRTTPH